MLFWENDLGTARDTQLTPIICDYIREKKSTFPPAQMDSVDRVGHGSGSPYLQCICEVDTLMNNGHEAADEASILDDTLFVVIADRGGTNPDKDTGSHNGWSDEEKYVTFRRYRQRVNRCDLGDINIRDIVAVVLCALGIEVPAIDEAGWTSQIPLRYVQQSRYSRLSRSLPADRRCPLRTSKVPHIDIRGPS